MNRDEKTYRKYVSEGPDALSLADVQRAIAFQDANPTEAHEIRAQHETAKREAEAKEVLKEQYVRDGGDAADFETFYRELLAESKKQRIAAMEADAHAQSWADLKRVF